MPVLHEGVSTERNVRLLKGLSISKHRGRYQPQRESFKAHSRLQARGGGHHVAVIGSSPLLSTMLDAAGEARKATNARAAVGCFALAAMPAANTVTRWCGVFRRDPHEDVLTKPCKLDFPA